MKTLTIRKPDDFHVHLRQDDMMRLVVPYTEAVFGRALVMPNIRMPVPPEQGDFNPPVRTGQDARWYRQEIMSASRLHGRNGFTPLMTIAITDQTTPKMIEEARAHGVVAGKIYPVGMTTHSEYGVSDMRSTQLRSVLRRMARVGMICCVHAEKQGAFVLDREMEFIDDLDWMMRMAPRLKIVVEHVSSEAMVRWVIDQNDRIAATVTVHHLFLTLDDVVGGMISPHHFCKPIAKRPQDRDALQNAVLTGNPKFFFGSDSAPHDITTKQCAYGCAGVFTAPVAIPLLAQFFDKPCKLGLLEPFVSSFGTKFYGLSPNQEKIELVDNQWRVPDLIGGLGNKNTVVPFWAGREIAWSIPRYTFPQT